MNTDIETIELNTQKQISLFQSQQEIKIAHLNSEIQLILQQITEKTQEIQTYTISNSNSNSNIHSKQQELDNEKSITLQIRDQLQKENEQEIMELNQQFSDELKVYQQAIERRDSALTVLQNEITKQQNKSCEKMDELKISYLSRIFDLSAELENIVDLQ